MPVGQVVIGSNYGDEGKGLITDYLASLDPVRTLVVRYNGGAQAGHTVVTAEGHRHIFSHFGAGSLLGCPTYLSRFFIVNPVAFVREHEELHRMGFAPLTYVSSKAFLSTPFDMFINQTLERARDLSRHGSCGLGINETVTRCLRSSELKTTAADLKNIADLLEKLHELGRTWVPERLAAHGVDCQTREVMKFLAQKDQILKRFTSELSEMVGRCQILDDAGDTDDLNCHEEIAKTGNIIFEGAQGLMLDEDRIDQWPFVTRSKTGLNNVLQLASKMKIDALSVVYVTRTYLTRHGAGPLPKEANWAMPDLLDSTNVPNQFQGKLRFAPMDWAQMNESIKLDLGRARLSGVPVKACLAVTCNDQVPMDDRVETIVPVKYQSFGPTRAHVIDLWQRKTVFARADRLTRKADVLALS